MKRSSDPEICVAIAEQSADACISALEGLNFAEIRLDSIAEASKKDARRIFSLPKKLIATFRPSGRDEQERKEILLEAIAAGAAYVDIELEAPAEYRNAIVKAAKAKGCKVIISYHNYEKTPSAVALGKAVFECLAAGADIAKIACQSSGPADNERLTDLIRKDGKVLAIGMGKKGQATRVVGPLLGCPFTFASRSEGKETAEGQMDKKTLAALIGRLRANVELTETKTADGHDCGKN